MSSTIGISTSKMFKLALFLNILCIVNVLCTSFLRQKGPKVDKFTGKCTGYPSNTPVQLKDVRLLRTHDKTYISGKIVVLQDNFRQYRVVIKSKKCNSQETLDTCEYVRELSLDKVCDGALVFEQALDSVIKSIQPKPQCPLKKGTYTITNGTIDIGPLYAIPEVDRWYWKAFALVYEQTSETLVSCIELHGQIVAI